MTAATVHAMQCLCGRYSHTHLHVIKPLASGAYVLQARSRDRTRAGQMEP